MKIAALVGQMEKSTKPAEVDGWNVAELAGGLLLSAGDFTVQFDVGQVDILIDILNSDQEGKLRDVQSNVVMVAPMGRDHIILTRVNDGVYPNGIILPVDAFTEIEEDDAPIIEGIKRTFRRVGSKIKRGFRVTSGRRKGRVVANPATANKPPIKGSTRMKLRIAGRRKKFIRALKSKMTRRKSASMRLRRMNNS